MGVSLNKGQSVSLVKKNSTYSDIVINLKWEQQKKNQGFLKSIFGGEKSVDLDLGCLYEMQDGKKGCVQALGDAFGSLVVAPYVQLDSDDRTGQSQEGETLRINGVHWEKIKRIMVYAFIYEGVPKWSDANGIVRFNSDVEQIDVTLDNSVNGKTMCGIALIENAKGQMKVTKVNDYFSGHEELDRAYSWNMQWAKGRK
jgi:tellurite resistance protein TerA